MSLESITQEFRHKASSAPSLGKTLKFVFDEGCVFLDLTGDNAKVTNENKEADCTIKTSVDTLNALRKGDLNPMMAVMSGKIKIHGDMGVAMKLQSLLGG
jgi:putative sterol carrier protein